VNTHFDHLSDRARRRSADAIRRFVAARALPAVVLGDLNAGEGSATVRRLLDAGALVDAWRAAAEHRTVRWGTYAGYRPPREGGRRLDWVLVTPGIEVRATAVNGLRHAGRWPSDHLPVQAVVRVRKEERA
jgi:endonuclease/exonuclease/phosphatase family metal-dependent hydrolase